MRLITLVAFLAVGACDAASGELPTLKEARSAAAEWAKVNELAAEGRLTAAYTAAMREEARSNLKKAARSLHSADSPAAELVDKLVALPPDASPSLLAGYADQLKQSEDRLAVS